jgi:DNA-binding NtrC family response regulator
MKNSAPAKHLSVAPPGEGVNRHSGLIPSYYTTRFQSDTFGSVRHPIVSMQRPCFIVVDREHALSLSTRKLVIETAKFNVLTAYTAREALETVKRFPAVDGMVIDADTQEFSCADFVRAVKQIAPALPIISVSTPAIGICAEADYHLETFDPARLLALLERLRPAAAAEIERHEENLKAQETRSIE